MNLYYKSLLSLMQLISSNLPIGGFNYSRGLEFAIESGWINSVDNFLDWQKQWINGQLIYLDWPMLKRCYHYTKTNNVIRFKEYAMQIVSYRDTKELRLEEQQRGRAISKLILQWYSPVDSDWISAFEYSGLASIAWLGFNWNIPLPDLALGYAYTILESSIIIGLKLILFGQQQAQCLLKHLMEFLPAAWTQAYLIKDDELGSDFLWQSIASACHEAQYSRLFRS